MPFDAHAYLLPLDDLFQRHANAENAGPMARYMRDQFPFLGIKTPQRRDLLKQFVAAHGLPPLAELETVVRVMWDRAPREYQYAALGLLGRLGKQLTPDFLPLLEYLIVTKSWWDTVDGLAGNDVGDLLARFPEARDPVIGRWRVADNIWLRRTTLLFQLGYKKQTDQELLFALIGDNLDSREFFIQKAIGWALREYSKTAPAAVRAFVAATPLAPLSAREALKWLNRQAA